MKILKIVMFLLLTFTLYSKENKISINQIPMYGSKDGNYKLTKNDKQFIDTLLKELGNSDEAYKECIKRAWQFYNDKDIDMTIVRANQGWLFNKNDYEVYYLFGIATAGKSYLEQTEYKISLINDAISYFILSIKYNDKHAMSYANIGRLCRDLVFSYFQFNKKSDQIDELMIKSKQFLEKSLEYAEKDEDFGYIYYQLAIQSAMSGDFKKAWENIYLVKKYNKSDLIEEGFIKKLESDYPDPGK